MKYIVGLYDKELHEENDALKLELKTLKGNTNN